MKRLVLVVLACGVLAACSDGGTGTTPAAPGASVVSATPSPDPLAVAVPKAHDVVRTFAPDGWPVFVIGRDDGKADVFGAVAEVGPGYLGDEVGWCHVSHMFQATRPGRAYDVQGRSLTGVGGLVRYDASVVGGKVHVGARGAVVTGQADPGKRLPCARRALLLPDYPTPATFETARSSTAPIRMSAVLTAAADQSLLCERGFDPDCLELATPLLAEIGARTKVVLDRTFWVSVADGKITRIATGDVPKPADDVSETEQFGYLAKVEGDWIYFDRAEILLGAAAVKAATEDGKPVPADGEHYFRNRNSRLRRYRVDAQTQFSYGNTVQEKLAYLKSQISKEYTLTIYTNAGRLLRIAEEGCGD